MGDPKTIKGGVGWLILGAVAGLIALTVGSLIPSIIPARAQSVRL